MEQNFMRANARSEDRHPACRDNLEDYPPEMKSQLGMTSD